MMLSKTIPNLAAMHLKLLTNNKVEICSENKQGKEWRCEDGIQIRGGEEGDADKIILSSDLTSGGNVIGCGVGVSREYSIPLLKSGIQKAVRRRLSDHAVALSQQMLLQSRDSLLQFLRRISIINIEDSLLHPQLIALSTWCMMAVSKGYSLHQSTQLLLLQYIGEIADMSSRMCYEPINRQIRLKKTKPKSEADFVIKMLKIRKSYGGMPGDMKLIDSSVRYAQQYTEMFYSQQKLNPSDTTMKSHISEIPYSLQPAYQLHEAVDFHCLGFLVSKTAAECQSQGLSFATPSMIKSLWWKYRSGVYINKPVVTPSGRSLGRVGSGNPTEGEQMWNVIYPIIDQEIAKASPWNMRPPPPKEKKTRSVSPKKKSGNKIVKKIKSDQPTITSAFQKSKKQPEIIIID